MRLVDQVAKRRCFLPTLRWTIIGDGYGEGTIGVICLKMSHITASSYLHRGRRSHRCAVSTNSSWLLFFFVLFSYFLRVFGSSRINFDLWLDRTFAWNMMHSSMYGKRMTEYRFIFHCWCSFHGVCLHKAMSAMQGVSKDRRSTLLVKYWCRYSMWTGEPCWLAMCYFIVIKHFTV